MDAIKRCAQTGHGYRKCGIYCNSKLTYTLITRFGTKMAAFPRMISFILIGQKYHCIVRIFTCTRVVRSIGLIFRFVSPTKNKCVCPCNNKVSGLVL